MTTTPEAPAKTLTQLVALEIRLEMVRQDLKQSQVARRIGKTEQWLSVRLRGRQPIDVNDLALIARGLGIGIHELLPDPETANGAAIAPYLPVTDQPIRNLHSPTDNRSNGHPGGPRHPGVRRTVPVRRSAPRTGA